jgi:hypothetical protein
MHSTSSPTNLPPVTAALAGELAAQGLRFDLICEDSQGGRLFRVAGRVLAPFQVANVYLGGWDAFRSRNGFAVRTRGRW